ncbi:MAG: hypothetical protein R3176_02910 [Woeseiaceae bacterium]|nr:hypothetical protein [Woeseiaceae bacterium]
MTRPVNGTATSERAAEQRVLDAVAARKVADFSSLPESERRLSADFLQRLISGSGGPDGGLCCPLRVRGAIVVGPLRPPSVNQLSDRAAVQFLECEFDSPVDLSGAEFLVLRIVDCKLPAFIGASLAVNADLDLSGSQFEGVSDYESELSQVGSCAIHLNNARIGGRLELSSTDRSRFRASRVVRFDSARIEGSVRLAGAELDGCGAPALSARSIEVGGNVELGTAAGHRFEARGEVAFVGAQITGDLTCDGARLWNPTGRALHCEDLKVESVMLQEENEDRPFEASGRLNFLSAVIGGSFFLTRARLAPGPDYEGLLRKGGPIALNLQQSRISNALAVRNIVALEDPDAPDGKPQPVRGWFLLTGSDMGTILDDVETGWPAAGYLDLDGATYARIRHIGGGDLTSKRIRWLRRQYPDGQPDPASFRPQPYEELSRVLREHGQSREANAIAVEKIRMRLAARVDAPWARIFPRLLMLVSHYGYSTSRAVASFLVFVLLGTVMYATALFGFGQPFVPVEHDPAPVTYEFAFGLAELSSDEGCPGLDVIHYALDSAMPVIDLGQDLRCRFTPEGPARWIWLILHSAYVVAGAALSAVVVLTLTGVLRQD